MQRLIDADKMLAELKPITYEMEQNAVTIADMSNIMRNWVCRQPTIPAPQWISVEDEELKIGVEVLTRDRYGNVRNRKLKMLSGLVLFYPDGLKPGKHITHWMALPEPPAQEADGE